jgi:hypothetical protein
MPEKQVLAFIQSQWDADEKNGDIVEELRERFQIDKSLRTLQRWIKTHNIRRSQFLTAFQRSTEWIDDVKSLIKRNIPRQEIVYHFEKNYHESICVRTLDRVLQVCFHYVIFVAFKLSIDRITVLKFDRMCQSILSKPW